MGTLPAGLKTLGRWVLAKGALDPAAPARTPFEANDAVIAATKAYLEKLDAGPGFAFGVAISIEDDAVLFEVEPTDSGSIWVPRLSDKSIRYAWRKRSYDLMMKAFSSSLGAYGCNDLEEYYSVHHFEGATTDEDAKEHLAEWHGMEPDDLESFYLPSTFRKHMPDVGNAKIRHRITQRSLKQAPRKLRRLWSELEGSIAAVRANRVAFKINRDNLPPDADDRMHGDYFEPPFAFFPCHPDSGPWHGIYDEMYSHWMQGGEERFTAGIATARTVDEVDQIIDSIARGAALVRVLDKMFDYWLPPAPRKEEP